MYTTLEHFLKYVTYDTQSDEEAGKAGKVPSTDTQWELAREMERELNERGFKDVSVSEHCYVMGKLPANTKRKIP
ncbi:MAG: peptidase T, partial [Synergistaceae bacterium]|nr:peptidase T [Synergistaceae bacterium]